jgi:hypothetical protein
MIVHRQQAIDKFLNFRGRIEKSELVTLLTNALRSKDKVCEIVKLENPFLEL